MITFYFNLSQIVNKAEVHLLRTLKAVCVPAILPSTAFPYSGISIDIKNPKRTVPLLAEIE